MSKRSQQQQRDLIQQLDDHAEVEQHAEYDAAIAVLCSLFDVDSFQRAWELMGQAERDDVTTAIADGIERRLDRVKRDLLIKFAAEI